MSESEIAMFKMIKGLIISTENLNGASIANSQAIQILAKGLEDFEKRISRLEGQVMDYHEP